MPSLREAQIEAAREVLGWEVDEWGEYADIALRTLGDVVDAVMEVEAAHRRVERHDGGLAEWEHQLLEQDAVVETEIDANTLAAIEAYANTGRDA